jgi:DNA helicase II / ATP-dependent DNA helicase PcrA
MDLLDDLNESQQQAVTHIDGPLLVLAGAGSGKTRVITRRVAYLVSQGVAPESILAITFTNKAAGEMRDRVIELNTPPGSLVCTFHSLCARLLRDYARQAGLSPNYTIYDRDDQLKVAKRALEAAETSEGYFTPARAHGAISNAKNQLRTAEGFAANAGDFYERNLAKVYAAYEKELAENNALDFDDLLMRVAFLLRDHEEIRTELTDRFQYVLIDEYQDTNHAQYLIAHTIAAAHNNLCATGDPDQSIYAWRGADINNILEFEKDYPGAAVIRLEENYRSLQPILTAASNLIGHNVNRKPKRLFTNRTGGEPVEVITVDDEHAEARQLAERIEQYRMAGGSYGDVAVFYRVNSLSRVLEEALLRRGIAYHIARGVEFYNRKEIKDVLAYLKLLINPADDVSCGRIINTPTRGIGATTIKRISAYAMQHGLSLFEGACQAEHIPTLSAGPTKKVLAFANMIRTLQGQLDRPVRMILADVYRDSGMEALFGRGDEDARQARSNVEELISSAAEFDEEDEHGLAEYLHSISLVSDVDGLDESRGAVTLMTLHAAKGLEFPVVFMVGCEEGLLPFERADEPEEQNPDKAEEERRLAFVGMTRAQQKLTLMTARTRTVRGQRMPAAASRFLNEIGDQDVLRTDKTTAAGRMGGRQKRFARGGFFDPGQTPSRHRKVTKAMDGGQIADWADTYETPVPPEVEGLRPGSRVQHPRFGVGQITKISGRWPETRATVMFHEVGQKKLVLAMANLTPLDDDPW